MFPFFSLPCCLFLFFFGLFLSYFHSSSSSYSFCSSVVFSTVKSFIALPRPGWDAGPWRPVTAGLAESCWPLHTGLIVCLPAHGRGPPLPWHFSYAPCKAYGHGLQLAGSFLFFLCFSVRFFLFPSVLFFSLASCPVSNRPVRISTLSTYSARRFFPSCSAPAFFGFLFVCPWLCFFFRLLSSGLPVSFSQASAGQRRR